MEYCFCVHSFTVALSNPFLLQMTESDFFFLYPNLVKPLLIISNLVFQDAAPPASFRGMDFGILSVNTERPIVLFDLPPNKLLFYS